MWAQGQTETLRTELNVTVGTLRREWSEAVEASGARHAERVAEMEQREARVKAIR
jgi:hypothetical protein